MADEVVLDDEVVTTFKKKYDSSGAFWRVSYHLLAKRSSDLKHWLVREIEFVGFDPELFDAMKQTMVEVESFMASCNYDLFSIREFDGERKEKYD